MRAIHGPTMGGAWVLTAVLVATACHNEPRPRSPGSSASSKKWR